MMSSDGRCNDSYDDRNDVLAIVITFLRIIIHGEILNPVKEDDR